VNSRYNGKCFENNNSSTTTIATTTTTTNCDEQYVTYNRHLTDLFQSTCDSFMLILNQNENGAHKMLI